jgi:pimeloyl-ACP methyl ester carboxylesterase
VVHTHVTAPTRFVEIDGIRFAYRRFGQESGIPLLFFQHFRGGMDHWDPAVTDGFAQDRPVVLFDNAGVAGTTGDTPNTVEAMADHAAAFVSALRLSQVDVLGFSIGGYVSQTLALRHRTLVRRMILVATGPRGGDPSQDSQAADYAASTDPITGESGLDAFHICSFAPLRRAKLPAERSGSVGTNGRGTLILRVRRRRWRLNEQRPLNGARYEENAFQNSRTFRSLPSS